MLVSVLLAVALGAAGAQELQQHWSRLDPSTWSQLTTRGYVLLQGFAPPELTRAISEHWRNTATEFTRGFKSTAPNSAALSEVKRRMAEVVRAVAAAQPVTGLTTPDPSRVLSCGRTSSSRFYHGGDFDGAAAARARGRGVAPPLLHSDRDGSWEAVRNTTDDLIFYLYVDKASTNVSNLRVIRFDRLSEEARRYYVGRGGQLYLGTADGLRSHVGHTVERDDCGQRKAPALSEAAFEEPQASAGDMIVFRGDTMHQGPRSSDSVAGMPKPFRLVMRVDVRLYRAHKKAHDHQVKAWCPTARELEARREQARHSTHPCGCILCPPKAVSTSSKTKKEAPSRVRPGVTSNHAKLPIDDSRTTLRAIWG